MAATCQSPLDLLQPSSSLHFRQSSSLFCSTSKPQTTPFFRHFAIGTNATSGLPYTCSLKESPINKPSKLIRPNFQRPLRRWTQFKVGPSRGQTVVRAKGRQERNMEMSEDEEDDALDMEVVDVGEDPFNEGGLDFEEVPVKAAKKSMEERVAFQAKDDKKRKTEMKEFTDASGKKVFLEVAVQDKSPEELEKLAWRDRELFDRTVENPPNFDSQYMDPFNFRAVLPEAEHDNDEFVFDKFPDVEDEGDEISNSVWRDDSANPNEEWYADDWAGPLTVTELEHTRFMMPSAWEGKLEDGREVYIKHRYGVLSFMILHRRGWRKKWNTVYYILHKHHLNSQCTTKRMRELLEGKVVNFACEIKFADQFDNVYDLYEGYEVERKMLESSQAQHHPEWELRTDFSKRDKIDILEKTKEGAFKNMGEQKHKL